MILLSTSHHKIYLIFVTIVHVDLAQSSKFLYCMTHRVLAYMVERDNAIKINVNDNGTVIW